MTTNELIMQKKLEKLLVDSFFNKAEWRYTVSWFPHRCYVSQRLLWGRHFKLVRTFGGIGGVFAEVRWLHRDVGMQIRLMMP